MPIVIDASVTMAWCFDDEATPLTDGLLDRLRDQEAFVPALWQLEVANVLLIAERRGRITEAQATRFLDLLMQLPIRIDQSLTNVAALLAAGRAPSVDGLRRRLPPSRGTNRRAARDPGQQPDCCRPDSRCRIGHWSLTAPPQPSRHFRFPISPGRAESGDSIAISTRPTRPARPAHPSRRHPNRAERGSARCTSRSPRAGTARRPGRWPAAIDRRSARSCPTRAVAR